MPSTPAGTLEQWCILWRWRQSKSDAAGDYIPKVQAGSSEVSCAPSTCSRGMAENSCFLLWLNRCSSAWLKQRDAWGVAALPWGREMAPWKSWRDERCTDVRAHLKEHFQEPLCSVMWIAARIAIVQCSGGGGLPPHHCRNRQSPRSLQPASQQGL